MKKNNFNTFKLLLNTGKKYNIPYFVLSAFQTIAETLLPLIEVFLIPMTLSNFISYRDTQENHWLHMTIGTACSVVILHFLLNFIKAFCKNKRNKYHERYTRLYQNKLLDASMQMKYKYTEKTEILDALNIASEGISPDYSNGLPGVTNDLITIIKEISVTAISITVIIVKAPILIPVIALICFLNMMFQKQINAIQYKFYEKLAVLNRQFGYITFSVADYRYAKDIRLFGAQDLILSKEKAYLAEQSKHLKEQEKEIRKYSILSAFSTFCLNIFVFAYTFILAVRKVITIPSFIQIVNSTTVTSQAITNLLKAFSSLKLNLTYAGDYFAFFDLIENEEQKELVHHQEKNQNIYIKNLSFTYPGTDIKILDDVNLTIEAGKSLSIVGLNGQGKTTLIKLLCKFYDEYEGQILYGNTDIREYSFEEWYEILGAVFQDFSLLPYSVKENITCSEDGTIHNEQLINSILNKNIKMDDSVTKELDLKGIDFSGGESQKIAIARAINKDSEILVLDEPTAALDAKAEEEIYNSFNTISRGKTVLFISHRLSSCKFCDKIIVVDKGKIAEQGTHETLLQKEDGLYRRMWNEQSSYYENN